MSEESQFERPKRTRRVNAFLNALRDLCREHGLSLGHQDGHGAFLVHEMDEGKVKWLLEAKDETPEGKALQEQYYRRPR